MISSTLIRRPVLQVLVGILLTILIFAACRPGAGGRSDYHRLPARLGDHWQMVVEIPAGTNLKLEYDARRGSFLPDSTDGQVRIIDFLPYPGNYGFVPSTRMERSSGGDGDPVDVLLLSETLPTGTVVRFIPIGVLLLEDDGEADTKIIAIPRDTSLQTFRASSYHDLAIRYQAARQIIEDWFLNYKGPGRTRSLGWRDERTATMLLEKYLLTGAEE